MSRHDIDLIGDPFHSASDEEGEGDAWMMSYLDVMTLLIAFFVLLLTLSGPGINNDLTLTDSTARSAEDSAEDSADDSAEDDAAAGAVAPVNATASQLPNGIGVLPEYNAPLAGRTGDTRPDAQDDGVVDNGAADGGMDGYQGRFGALENSLNALALQGVDATPGREGLTLRIADNLLFASGESELRYEGMLLISQLQEVLDGFEGEISVEGHTDNVPINTACFPSNWELSSARAIAVLRYLEFEGISATRMRAIGYADTRPLQDNNSLTGRAANRRVELILREP